MVDLPAEMKQSTPLTEDAIVLLVISYFDYAPLVPAFIIQAELRNGVANTRVVMVVIKCVGEYVDE